MALIHGLDELEHQRNILRKDLHTVAKQIEAAPEDEETPAWNEAFTRLTQGVCALNAVEEALTK
jgi:hypothetical protein